MKKYILTIILTIIAYLNVIAQCTNYPFTKTFYDPSGTLVINSNNYTQDINNIQSNIVIDGNVSFTDAVLVIESGLTITVSPGSSLTLNGCHLFACANMWGGIIAQSVYDYNTQTTIYSTLRITKSLNNESSLIEDAETAVKYSTGNQVGYYSTNENLVDIENTIFNKNFINVSLNDFNFINTQTFNYPSANNPFSIKNVIITCRDIPIDINNLNHWASIYELKNTTTWQNASYPNTPNVMTSPYINDALFSQINTNSFLKFPHENEKSDIGIQIQSVPYPGSIGFTYFTIGEPTLNQGTNDWNTNIFDNLRIGIYAHNCYANIRNCTFQNLVDKYRTAFDATGVLAENNDELDFYLNITSQIGEPRNAFFDCKYAIQATHYQSVEISNCDIRSDNRFNNYGENGINIQTWRVTSLEVSKNNISNITNGIVYRSIRLNKPIIYSTGGSQVPTGEINIYKNSINRNANSLLVANLKNLENAINLEVETPVMWTNCNTGWCTPNALRCVEKAISKYANGIRIAGFENKNCRILNNTIDLGASITNAAQFGIKAEGCIAYNANNGGTNNGNFIYNNKIDGLLLSTAANIISTGIDIAACNNFTINCNVVANYKYGIKFNGDNTPNTNVFTNEIANSNAYGLSLISAGRIGQQGSTNFASDNSFLGYAGSGRYTLLCQQSLATNSPMYVQLNQAPYDPNNPVGLTELIGLGNRYLQTNNSLRDALPSNYPCNIISWKQSNNNSTGYIGSENYNRNNIKDAEALALGTIPMPSIDQLQDRLFVMKLQLYKSLLGCNASMASQSIILNNFVTNPPIEFKNIQAVEEQLANNNIATINQLLANWKPQNIVAANYKQYYTWYLGKPNLKELLAFSQLCPLTNGTVIYKARALYNNLAYTNIIFNNNCDIKTNLLNSNELPLNVTIYPNPTTNYVKISCGDLKQIEVFNNLGILVLTIKVLTDNYTLETNKMPKGLYLIKITTTDNKQGTRKLIIN